MKKEEFRPRAMKAGQAAEYMGISRRYLHDLSQAGRIPYIKVSTLCIVCDIADLDEFLDSCKIGAES